MLDNGVYISLQKCDSIKMSHNGVYIFARPGGIVCRFVCLFVAVVFVEDCESHPHFTLRWFEVRGKRK